jgi:hypothetical protein
VVVGVVGGGAVEELVVGEGVLLEDVVRAGVVVELVVGAGVVDELVVGEDVVFKVRFDTFEGIGVVDDVIGAVVEVVTGRLQDKEFVPQPLFFIPQDRLQYLVQ